MNNNQNGMIVPEVEQLFNGEETLIPRTTSASFTLQAGDTLTLSISHGVNGNDNDALAAISLPVPSIASFSPASGLPGTPVTITGSGLSQATSVSFNGTFANFTRNANNTLTAYVPEGATDGPISIGSALGAATSAQLFDVLPNDVPAQFTVKSFSPAQGPQGTPVIIKGVGFTGVQRVAFGNPNGKGDTPAQFEVLNDEKIRAFVPPVTDFSQLGFKTIKVKKGQLLVNATTLFNVTYL